MNRQEIEKQVKKVLIEQLGVAEDRIKPESSIFQELDANTDLCADSLGVVEVWMGLEECFDLDIPDEDAMKLIRVKDIVDYLEANT